MSLAAIYSNVIIWQNTCLYKDKFAAIIKEPVLFFLLVIIIPAVLICINESITNAPESNNVKKKLKASIVALRRSQWPRGLRRRAARLLKSWVRIPLGASMFVCCVLSGRGLCDEPITRPEESYRLWCVVVGDLETSGMRRP